MMMMIIMMIIIIIMKNGYEKQIKESQTLNAHAYITLSMPLSEHKKQNIRTNSVTV